MSAQPGEEAVETIALLASRRAKGFTRARFRFDGDIIPTV
jgi:hypothetical protein